MSPWIRILIYLVAAPIVGGLLAGWDRRMARMQSRRGPPIRQPFYDVQKLWSKQNIVVRRSQNFYIGFFLLMVVFTGALFFGGSDLLLVIFALTLAAIFFVLGAYKASSPYSFIGAERELIQMMAYEPMVLLTAIGMYMVTKSFAVNDIANHPTLLVLALPGIFLGFLYTLEIKFRKSPFDLSAAPRASGAGARHHHRIFRTHAGPDRNRALVRKRVPAGLGLSVLRLNAGFGRGHVVVRVCVRHSGGQRVRPAQVADGHPQRVDCGAVFGFGNILVLSLLSAKPAIPAAPAAAVTQPAVSGTVPAAAATPVLNNANAIARRN